MLPRSSSPLCVNEETGKSINSHSPVELIPLTDNSPEIKEPLSTFT